MVRYPKARYRRPLAQKRLKRGWLLSCKYFIPMEGVTKSKIQNAINWAIFQIFKKRL
jgi:hypothetical protein